jgi:predicted DNA-binding transcriptional regulator AlpA
LPNVADTNDDLARTLDGLLARFADLVAERIVARSANGNGNAPEPEGLDRLLTVAEAASRLAVKPRWLYGHAKVLPFAVHLPGRALRFSERGLAKWLEKRRPR